MIGVAMLLSLFGARLVQLQGIDPKAYAAMAAEAGARTQVLPAKRGEIVDRNGTPFAESVNGLMLIADPVQTKSHAGQIAGVLADELGLDYFDTLAKLQKTPSRFQYLARRVPSARAEAAIAELEKHTWKNKAGMPQTWASGIYTDEDPVRRYPAEDIGANLVGFLNDAGEPGGGLEASFNNRLAGKDGVETYEVGGGQRIPLGDNSTTQPQNGRSLKLTLDRDLQWYVTRVLRNAVQSSRSDSGSAVVLDTKTGEVLALADFPTFDANQPGKAKEGNLGSRALSDVYEPGSVEKVLTFATLLDAGKVTPTTQITVPRDLPVLDRTIHDWFDHPTLRLTATGVIAKSSNIGTTLATQQLSDQQLYDKLREFGLGTKTNIGLNGETAGIVPDPSTWSEVNQATISFGQGISVNTLQMAAAINAVANQGTYVAPSLIKGAATTDSGTKVGTDYTKTRRVVSKTAAEQMAEMMESVPNPETGTAPGSQVMGYRVSGKTGTAQRVGENCGCYDGTFTVSFAGFAPADDPRFTVYVVVQNPRNGGGGGSIGGPAFSKIMTNLLSRYSVPPTGTPAADLPIEW